MWKSIFRWYMWNYNNLDEAGIFVSVSTDNNAENLYYIVKFMVSPYTMKDEAIINGHIISSVESFFNAAYLTKVRHGSKRYAQTYVNNFVIPLHICFVQ